MECTGTATDDFNRYSQSAASSVDAKPPCASTKSTPHSYEPARKRVKLDGGSGIHADSQRDGDTFSGSTACDSSRQHNGHVFGGVHHHYQEAPPWASTGAGTASYTSVADKMDALNFSRVDIRRNNISKEHRNTCEWLYDKPEYKSWRDPNMMSTHHGFFWIKSKPGAGKSTIMNFLVKSAKRRLRGDTIISFFFHARGEVLERSVEGMYRSLLHQLLTACPRLQQCLASVDVAGFGLHGWPVEKLKSMFHDAILELGEDKLTCFIDALDECPEDDIRAMIKTLSELSESAIESQVDLHVCFSSRPYPNISIRKCQHLELDRQSGHRQDVSDYVRSELLGDDEVIHQIKLQVEERARGIFLWAVLVVKILNKDSDRGDVHKMQDRLDEIPDGLHDLFEDILQRGVADDEHLVHILQWVLCARRPLSRAELYFAVHSGTPDPISVRPWNANRITPKTIDLFILNSSKGLVECTIKTKDDTSTVQFIHESVRDYLLASGFRAIAPNLDSGFEGLTHDYIRRCCAASITQSVLKHLLPSHSLPKAKSEDAIDLRQCARDCFPFLEYAVKEILHHAELACRNHQPQDGFLNDFAWPLWRVFHNLFAVYDTRWHNAPADTVTYALAEKGLQDLLSVELRREVGSLTSDQLLAAARVSLANGHTHIFAVILECGTAIATAGPAYRKTLISAMKSKNLDATVTLLRRLPRPWVHIEDLFRAAINTEKLDFVHLFIDQIAGLDDDLLAGAAQIAVREGYTETAQTLIEHSAGTRFLDAHRILHEASGTGSEELVRLLLDRGAKVSVGNGTALNRACIGGHARVVQMILEKGAGPNLKVHNTPYPLSQACSRRHENVVRVLLEYGAGNNAFAVAEALAYMLHDTKYVELDQLAEFDSEILDMLVEYGANPDIQHGKDYRAVLKVAADRGYNRVIRVLLPILAKIDGVQMHRASWYGKLTERVVKLRKHYLESWDPDISEELQCQIRDAYANALSRAKEEDWTEVVDLLQERMAKTPDGTATV